MIAAPNGTIIGLGRQKIFGKTPVCISDNSAKAGSNAKDGIERTAVSKSVITAGGYVFAHTHQEKSAKTALSQSASPE